MLGTAYDRLHGRTLCPTCPNFGLRLVIAVTSPTIEQFTQSAIMRRASRKRLRSSQNVQGRTGRSTSARETHWNRFDCEIDFVVEECPTRFLSLITVLFDSQTGRVRFAKPWLNCPLEVISRTPRCACTVKCNCCWTRTCVHAEQCTCCTKLSAQTTRKPYGGTFLAECSQSQARLAP